MEKLSYTCGLKLFPCLIQICEVHVLLRDTCTVRSRFVTVRFTTVHFYDPCGVGPSAPNLWCITVATQASFLYLVRF
jgi:hypothetical protein